MQGVPRPTPCGGEQRVVGVGPIDTALLQVGPLNQQRPVFTGQGTVVPAVVGIGLARRMGVAGISGAVEVNDVVLPVLLTHQAHVVLVVAQVGDFRAEIHVGVLGGGG